MVLFVLLPVALTKCPSYKIMSLIFLSGCSRTDQIVHTELQVTRRNSVLENVIYIVGVTENALSFFFSLSLSFFLARS